MAKLASHNRGKVLQRVRVGRIDNGIWTGIKSSGITELAIDIIRIGKSGRSHISVVSVDELNDSSRNICEVEYRRPGVEADGMKLVAFTHSNLCKSRERERGMLYANENKRFKITF